MTTSCEGLLCHVPRVVTYNRVDCIIWLALAAGRMGQSEQKYTLTLTSSKLHWYPFRLYHLFLFLQLIQESFLQFNFLLLQKSDGNNCSIVKPWHKFSRAKLIIRSGCRWNSWVFISMARKYKELLITKQPKLATEQFLKPKLSEW